MPTETVSAIEGVRILTLDVYGDLRGRFCEIFRSSSMAETFVQCNHSRSATGVLRGLHYHRHQADLWYVPGGRAQVVVPRHRIDMVRIGKLQLAATEKARPTMKATFWFSKT